MRRKCYNLAFKLKLINLVQNSTLYRVLQDYKVSTKMLRSWCRQKEKIKQTMYRTSRGRVQRRHVPPFNDLEDELYKWIVDRRLLGHIVDGNAIRSKAREIATRTNIGNFKCSSGWLVRFLRRKKLRFRRVTSSGRELPKNANETISTFINLCSNHVVSNRVARASIYNFDETVVYLDSFCKILIIYTYFKKLILLFKNF